MFELSRAGSALRTPSPPLILLGAYLIYVVTMELFTHGTDGLNRELHLYIMLFFLLVYQSQRNSVENLNIVVWSVLALSAVWMTWTYFFLSTVDARAMRMLVRSTEETAEFIEMGIGGYGMAYAAVLLLPVLTILSLKPRLIQLLDPPKILLSIPYLPQMIVWYTATMCVLLILSSQFTTALLAAVFSVITLVALWQVSIPRIALLILIAVSFFAFGETLILAILKALTPLAEGTNYALKLHDIISTIEFDAASGSAEERTDRYYRSIELFLEYPLTGVLYYSDLGKHSTILDAFARWGVLFGGILTYLVFFLPISALRSGNLVPGGAGAALGTIVAIFFVLVFNKHFAAAGIVIFIVYPAVFNVLKSARAAPARRQLVPAHA
jgi:hypothetical protein